MEPAGFAEGYRLNWQRKPVRLKILKERIIPVFGVFPSSHPQVAFLVLIEHGGDGSGEAAQTARKLIEWWEENRGGKSGK